MFALRLLRNVTVTEAPACFARQLSNASSFPFVTYSELKKVIENKDPNTRLIDVREPEEYAAGAIPTAKNIPCKHSSHQEN